MADSLVARPENSSNTQLDSAIASDDLEMKQPYDSKSSLECEAQPRLGGNDEIVWRYLTFSTELPSPAHLYHDDPVDHRPRAAPPTCPDLRKYDSPFQWPEKRKTWIIWLSCTATLFTSYSAGSYAAGYSQMSREWHVSEVALGVAITTFTCGFALAPMVLAPFSEINGRRPVFLVTGVLFVFFQLTCALTPTYGGMLVARFFAGCTCSTFSTMVGGVVSDIYHAENRNTAMALFAGAALLGTGLGPLISGFVAYHLSWRWIFYIQVIGDGVLMVFLVVFFQETRGSVLLSRRAKTLNKWYEQLEDQGYFGVMRRCSDDPEKLHQERIRWKVKADEERGSITQMIRISLYRPFYMLIAEPVVFFFSLWITFSWVVLYMTFTAIPQIFETTYGFNVEQTGSVFTAIAVGAILFTFVSIYQDRVALKYFPKRKQLLESPEGRLFFPCLESILLPIGCIWFCVTGAYPSIHWIVPTMGVAAATMGIFSIYLAVFLFLADCYHRYASSALAAQSFCRNFAAGAAPLFSAAMFNGLTFQGAGGLLGGLGLLLTVVPWVLLLYGPKIRSKSKLASEITGDKD